jgi:hypothetical protein
MAMLASALLLATGAAACNGGGEGDGDESATSAAIVTQAPEVAAPTASVGIGTATLTLVPPAVPPGVRQTFMVVVRISGATDLGAYQITPAFDPALLELLNIRDGAFLGSTGRTPSCGVDRAPPPLAPTFFCATAGSSPAGPSGEGELATMEFRALAGGTVELRMQQVVLTTPEGVEVPVVAEGTTLAVQ